MKIIGAEHKSGMFEGNAYNNVVFHCTENFDEGKGAGQKVKSVKVRYNALSENFGKQLTEKEIFAFVGKEVVFYYDEFKNVNFVNVLNQK